MRPFTKRWLSINLLLFFVLLYNAYIRGNGTYLQEPSSFYEDEKLQRKKDSVQKMVRDKIFQLQNPNDCENTRKLVCKIHALCGLGCQLHHIGICMFLALNTNRTLVTNVRWLEDWLSQVFQPISGTCQSSRKKIVQKRYPEFKDDENIQGDVQLTINTEEGHFTETAIKSLRSSFLSEMHEFNRYPVVWWIGQVMAYICRFTPSFKQEVESYQKKLGLDSDEVMVGRTQLAPQETATDNNDWYMRKVVEWYDKREAKTGIKVPRRVYLATDDIYAISSLRKSYPAYTFICDVNVQKVSTIFKRTSLAGIKGLMYDVNALSKCSFVVCTFSSNVGRLVYELMQSNTTDLSRNIISLDEEYKYTTVHTLHKTDDDKVNMVKRRHFQKIQPDEDIMLKSYQDELYENMF